MYNCRLICSRESDLIRKSEKESTSVGLESQKDAVHIATDVLLLLFGDGEAIMSQLKGTDLGKAVETQFTQAEKGFEGEEDELSLKKNRKRERKDSEDKEGEDDEPDFKELHVGEKVVSED